MNKQMYENCQWSHEHGWYRAIKEHAWLLRAEGLSYRQIGERCGVSGAAAHRRAQWFSKRICRAMRHTKWRRV